MALAEEEACGREMAARRRQRRRAATCMPAGARIRTKRWHHSCCSTRPPPLPPSAPQSCRGGVFPEGGHRGFCLLPTAPPGALETGSEVLWVQRRKGVGGPPREGSSTPTSPLPAQTPSPPSHMPPLTLSCFLIGKGGQAEGEKGGDSCYFPCCSPPLLPHHTPPQSPPPLPPNTYLT